MVISAVVALGAFAAAYWVHGFYNRCPFCRKKYAMKRQSKECVDRYPESVGSGSNARVVMKVVYHLHRKCKYCGGEDYVEITDTKK